MHNNRPPNAIFLICLQKNSANKFWQAIIRPAASCLVKWNWGEQFGVSRTAVREAVKMLAAKGMLLPRPRIGTRVMPQSQWNFLDQDLLTWWMTRENFDQVMQHFLILRTSLEPQACALAAKPRQPAAKQVAGGANGGNARAAYPV
ncbi:Transcriptional regulators [Serratia marcescens]|uniref:Transcriptional regulators n=1 Tax=Serratia marcescens TaxID=615 RepID=A0A379Y8Q6_SERMA|nr:Transcriptional regulators [Serratia marcescens]